MTSSHHSSTSLDFFDIHLYVQIVQNFKSAFMFSCKNTSWRFFCYYIYHPASIMNSHHAVFLNSAVPCPDLIPLQNNGCPKSEKDPLSESNEDVLYIHHVSYCGPNGEGPAIPSKAMPNNKRNSVPIDQLKNKTLQQDIPKRKRSNNYQSSRVAVKRTAGNTSNKLEKENSNDENKGIINDPANNNAVHVDPIDIFFKSMSETVKQFPQHLVTEAKMRVCNLIGELELQAYLHKNSIITGPIKKNSNVAFNNLFY